MKRILILLASLFFLSPASAGEGSNGKDFGEQQRWHYSTHGCYYDDMACALAIAEDGSFGRATYRTIDQAKYHALLQCRRIASKPETCEIVDINSESEFITKTQDSSESVQEASTVANRTLKECFDLFHFGPLTGASVSWEEYVTFDNHIILDRGECDAYVSDDYAQWIGPILEDDRLNAGNRYRTYPPFDVEKVAKVTLSRVSEQECLKEFRRQGGRKWKYFVEWGTHSWLSPGDCDAYVSEDRLTWIGSSSLVDKSAAADSGVNIDSGHHRFCLLPNLSIKKLSQNECLSRGGTAYGAAGVAANAKRRAQRCKSDPSWCVGLVENTVLSKLESQPTQTAEAASSELELEFWKSIRDSDNPDLFRAYLSKFPDGEFEIIAHAKIKELSDTSVVQASIPNLDYGRYHALVIGNNRYQNFKDLNTPINDARTVSRILRESYGFKTDVLENATESEMFKAIVELRSNVGRNDNVLIYFGGHGELDQDTEEGFWIPSDARRDDPSTYIPVDRIRKQIKAMPAKHVMVVADSCFSGSLTRSTLTRALKVKPRSPEYRSELQRIIDKKSRTALTSGGLEPVLDSGGEGHSVFASALISALRDNDGILDAHELFIQIRKRVRNNSPQDPEYSPIYETGHDHGDFLFVRR